MYDTEMLIGVNGGPSTQRLLGAQHVDICEKVDVVARSVPLAILLLWTSLALSGGHQWVAGDVLEPGHVYILQSRTPIHPPWQPPGTTNLTHGPYWVSGGPIRVHERVEHDGRPWYRVTWM